MLRSDDSSDSDSDVEQSAYKAQVMEIKPNPKPRSYHIRLASVRTTFRTRPVAGYLSSTLIYLPNQQYLSLCFFVTSTFWLTFSVLVLFIICCYYFMFLFISKCIRRANPQWRPLRRLPSALSASIWNLRSC